MANLFTWNNKSLAVTFQNQYRVLYCLFAFNFIGEKKIQSDLFSFLSFLFLLAWIKISSFINDFFSLFLQMFRTPNALLTKTLCCCCWCCQTENKNQNEEKKIALEKSRSIKSVCKYHDPIQNWNILTLALALNVAAKMQSKVIIFVYFLSAFRPISLAKNISISQSLLHLRSFFPFIHFPYFVAFEISNRWSAKKMGKKYEPIPLNWLVSVQHSEKSMELFAFTRKSPTNSEFKIDYLVHVECRSKIE